MRATVPLGRYAVVVADRKLVGIVIELTRRRHRPA